MPCDNYSTYDVDNTYSECIDFIETLYQSNDCNYFIATGDFNTCFSRDNGIFREVSRMCSVSHKVIYI